MNRCFKQCVMLSAVFLVFMISTHVQAVTDDELEKIESALPERAWVTPKQPGKLLVFTLCRGQKRLSIPYATKALELIGKKTGAFEVIQSKDMSVFEPENLCKYDAVCLNNTTYLEFSEQQRKDLLDFVKGGKGLIGIHAAIDNFYGWREGAEMIGGLYDHKPWIEYEDLIVKLDDPNHPLTAMFDGQGFTADDKLFRVKSPYSRFNVRVLLSFDYQNEIYIGADTIESVGRDIPISWVRSHGKGRVFYCSLGGKPDVFWNPWVLQHYMDGIQFALGDLPADTTPSASNIMEKVANYEHGQSRRALVQLEELVRSGRDSAEIREQIEQRLIQFLLSDATSAGKRFVCRQLSIIGTQRSVPVLSQMLGEPDIADMARYALERIPGEEVNKTLREILKEITGSRRIGIINTLGQRADSNSISVLSTGIYSEDAAYAQACVNAIGKIGTDEAVKVLFEACEKTTGQRYLQVLDGLLMCAENLVAEGNIRMASKIYNRMCTANEPVRIRIAAIRGMVNLGDEDFATDVVVGALRSDVQAIQSASVELVNEIPSKRIVMAVTEELPRLNITTQVQLLSALADRGDRAALPAVMTAAGLNASVPIQEQAIRIAGLKAVGKLGDASMIRPLVMFITRRARGEEEKQAAREALYSLHDADEGQAISGVSKINKTIIENLRRSPTDTKIELFKALGERHAYSAADEVLMTARVSGLKEQAEAMKTLRIIAGQEQLKGLVRFLTTIENKSVRNEAQKTVALVARKIPDKNKQADAILDVLSSIEDVDTRCSLMQVLGQIGDSKSASFLRQALKDENDKIQIAAIRAVSNWPNAEMIDDLRQIARTSNDKIKKVLALRGYIRMVGLDSDSPVEKILEMYEEAMQLADADGEKKMVLSQLGDLKSIEAMKMAKKYLDNENLQQEAAATVVKIAGRIFGKDLDASETALKKVLEISKIEQLRDKASEILGYIEQYKREKNKGKKP